MLQDIQITTDSTIRSYERNQIVKRANIRCHAIGCDAQAIRYSNLCSKCEYGYLNWNNMIFGKPSAKTMTKANEIIRSYYAADIKDRRFRGWANQIAQAMVRPEGKAYAPLRIKDMATPTARLDHLLAWRAKGKKYKGKVTQAGTMGSHAVLNMLAYALSIDTLITPTIPRPIRADYLTRLIGRRFMGSSHISRTKMRLTMKREKTGHITYTNNGPQEDIRWIETEAPETQHYRIKSADFRLIGRRLWSSIEKLLIPGGRAGSTWSDLQDQLRVSLKEAS